MRALVLLPILTAALLAQEDGATADPIRFQLEEQTAFQHYEKGEYDQAVAAFERQIAVYSNNPSPYYNIACCYALQGKAERAAIWLKLAVDRGWRDLRHLERDTDFDKIRETDAYRTGFAQLAAARRRDPDPLPNPARIDTVSAAPSAAAVIVASALAERAVERERALLTEGQFRRRIFPVYDRKMGRLERYMAEHGDARDAHFAAHERVRTGMLYLALSDEHDENDRGPRRAAATVVYGTAEQFLRIWAGSPLRTDVLMWRAHALGILGQYDEAARSLGALADDLDGTQRGRALVELCVVLAKAGRVDQLKLTVARLEKNHEKLLTVLRPRLTHAWLMAKGVPRFGTRQDSYTLYAFVRHGDPRGEWRLASLRAFAEVHKHLQVVVACVDKPSKEVAVWLDRHTKGLILAGDGAKLAERMWISRLPTVVVAKGDRLVAMDPTDGELRTLLAK